MLSALGLACVLQLPLSSCATCGGGGAPAFNFPPAPYRTHHGPPLSQRWALPSKPDYWAPWFPSGYCCTLGTISPNGVDYYSYLMAQKYAAPVAAPAGAAQPSARPVEPAPPAPAVPTTGGEPPR